MKNWILLILTIIMFPCHTMGQSGSDSTTYKYKNSVSITFLGIGEIGSISFSKILKEGKRGILVGNVMYTPASDFSAGLSIFSAGGALSEYFGKGNHHFVLGAGYYIQKFVSSYTNYDGDYHYDLGFHTFPNIEVGYAYWYPGKRFALKIVTNFRYEFDFNSTHFLLNLWPGISCSYGFNVKHPLFKINTITNSKYNSHFAMGYEINSGIGSTSLNNMGNKTSISLNNNLFIKYYLSRFYMKVFAGISYLNYRQVEESDTVFTIYKHNPVIYDLGLGFGLILFEGKKFKAEAGCDFGNFINKNKLMAKPETNQDYYPSNRADYELPALDYELTSMDRPCLISPEVKAYWNFNRHLSVFTCIRYTINYYQFAGWKAEDFVLKNREYNLGFGLQYNFAK